MNKLNAEQYFGSNQSFEVLFFYLIYYWTWHYIVPFYFLLGSQKKCTYFLNGSPRAFVVDSNRKVDGIHPLIDVSHH